jgi:DNA-binding transcriptional ArsR family regulator
MEINQAEKILKALANRRRLKIIKYLNDNKKASVTELAGYLKLSFKSTSKHLAVFKNVDIVEAEQVSLSYFYSLAQPPNPLVKQLLSIV